MPTHQQSGSQRIFIYVDSSQQEQDHYRSHKVNYSQEERDDLSYRDSSSYSSDQYHNDTNRQQKRLSKEANSKGNVHKNNKGKPNRLCKVKSDKFLLKDNYIQTVQRIIKENQQRLAKKTPLLITDTDKQILENLQKRKKNYGFFLRTIQTDKNYGQLLNKKVQKLKMQNQRKKQILINKKTNQQAKQDQNQMKKYVLDKKLKEQIVIDKVQKHAYKLGIQRIRNQQKKTKSDLKKIQQENFIKTINLDIKQRNQIYELREQLQMMRKINHVNKVDQRKVLKDLEKDVVHSKQALVTKAQTAQLNKFVI